MTRRARVSAAPPASAPERVLHFVRHREHLSGLGSQGPLTARTIFVCHGNLIRALVLEVALGDPEGF